jgi:hypothetical protein
MTFTGRQLLDLGVPPNKIKFYVNREFQSTDEIFESLNVTKVQKTEKVFTWVDWIWQEFQSFLPMKFNGNLPVKMSKSELVRLLDSKSIEINNKFPNSKEECILSDFPVTQFTWFPKSKNKVTWMSQQ